MDQRPFLDGMFDAVEEDDAVAVEDVIEFSGSFMEVKFGAVDVDGMGPGGGGEGGVFAADESVAPSAGAPFARGVSFVADEDRAGGA